MTSPYPPFTRDSVEQMLAFLPAFEAGQYRGADEHYQAFGEDLPLVRDLGTAVATSGFIAVFDWTTWTPPSDVSQADMETLRKLLTAYVRADRSSGGLLPALCADGTIEKALRRLREIAG